MTVSADEYRVVVVLDPQCGDRILEVGRTHDIWITPSEANREAAHRLRKLVELEPGERSVSMWSAPRTGATEAEWKWIMEDVELHHGEYSHDPPVTVLHVIGLALQDHVVAGLEAFGYTDLETTTDGGFIARRELPPDATP